MKAEPELEGFVERTPVLCIHCPRRASGVTIGGLPFCSQHAAHVRRYYPNEGPDRTPLVHRVLLGLAVVAMVTFIVVGFYVGLALLLAKAHSGVR